MKKLCFLLLTFMVFAIGISNATVTEYNITANATDGTYYGVLINLDTGNFQTNASAYPYSAFGNISVSAPIPFDMVLSPFLIVGNPYMFGGPSDVWMLGSASYAQVDDRYFTGNLSGIHQGIDFSCQSVSGGYRQQQFQQWKFNNLYPTPNVAGMKAVDDGTVICGTTKSGASYILKIEEVAQIGNATYPNGTLKLRWQVNDNGSYQMLSTVPRTYSPTGSYSYPNFVSVYFQPDYANGIVYYNFATPASADPFGIFRPTYNATFGNAYDTLTYGQCITPIYDKEMALLPPGSACSNVSSYESFPIWNLGNPACLGANQYGQNTGVLCVNSNGNNIRVTYGGHNSGASFVTDTMSTIFDPYPPVQTGLISIDNINDTTFCDIDRMWCQGTNFPGAQFEYVNSTNTLLGIYPQELADFDPFGNQGNTLANPRVDCGSHILAYADPTISNVNVPSPQKYIVCYRDGLNHGNKTDFYVSIKVINNSDVRGNDNKTDLDFYWAVYYPTFNIFSNVFETPEPGQVGQNATIGWQSRNATTSIVKLQYLDPSTSIWSALAIINDSSLVTQHIVNIPSQFMPIAGLYRYMLSGTDASNRSMSSIFYFFNVTGTLNLTAPVYGLFVYTQNEFGFPTPSGITIDGSAQMPTQSYMTQSNQIYFGVDIPKSLATVGNHTLTAIDFASTGRSARVNTSVTQYPTFLLMTLIPSGCIPYSFNPTQDQCNINANDTSMIALLQSKNVTNWYCQFSPDTCNLYNFTTGTCLETAGQRHPPESWVLFACFNNFLPSGITGNATQLPYSVPPNASASHIAGKITGDFFGVGISDALFFLGMMISLVLTAVVAFFTKSGLVGSITFLGSVISFTAVTWIPPVITIILAVLTSLLIAKFVANALQPTTAS